MSERAAALAPVPEAVKKASPFVEVVIGMVIVMSIMPAASDVVVLISANVHPGDGA